MELIVPGQPAAAAHFDQRFFTREFEDGDVPRCSLEGELDVVELVLVNGQTCDVNCFEEFRREFLVVTLFQDPPQCDHLYRSYIRYDSILRVNVRKYAARNRRLGFLKAHSVLVEEAGAGA
jgi:hypothetical protein